MKKAFRKPYQIKEKKPIFKNRFFWISLLILIFGGTIFYFFIFSLTFQIKEIKIFGNQKVLAKDLENLIQNRIEKKLFLFSTKSIFLANLSKINEDILEKFPQIAQINLKRKFPNILAIKIEEREPIAIFCQTDKCFLIDKEGVIFEKVSETDYDPPTTPYIEIKNLTLTENVELGEKAVEKEKINQILEVESKLKDYNPPLTLPQERAPNLKISEVSIISDERLNAKTSEDWEIYFNLKGDLNWQITELRLVLEKKIPPEKRGDLEYIDLRFSRVYYRYK